jgi:TRAP-type C4-dicarboxylate transport system permease small subunit
LVADRSTIDRPETWPAALQAISWRLNQVVTFVTVLVIVAMLAISTYGMFSQFVLARPLTWNFPLVKLLIPWLAMLSITVAFRHGEHIAMEMLLDLLPPRGLALVRLCHDLIVAAFALGLIWYGWFFFRGATQLMMLSANLQVSRTWVAASVPVAGLILLVHALAGLSNSARLGRPS